MLGELLRKDCIVLELEASDKKDALYQIAELAFKHDIVSSVDDYYEGLIEREGEGTTGFGFGFAIPHAKVDAVNKTALLAIKFARPIEWEAMDGKQVAFAIVIAVRNEEGDQTHLKVLSIMARKLMHQGFREALLQASDKNMIYEILTGGGNV